MFRENNRYEILTPTGWKDFKGVMNKGVKSLFDIVLENEDIISATEDHQFTLPSGERIATKEIRPGTRLKTLDGEIEIVSVSYRGDEDVFDIIEVSDERHEFVIQSKIITKNCDEFAFVRPNLANEFWTSIQPVLSTGGACIITSTPKSDEDQFAQIWKGAINNTDEFGNTLPNGEGRNGFFPIKVKWDAHPERDESWAEPFRNSLGPAKFAQEFECVIGDTMLELTNANDEWQMMSIGDLYEYLKGKNANGKHV